MPSPQLALNDRQLVHDSLGEPSSADLSMNYEKTLFDLDEQLSYNLDSECKMTSVIHHVKFKGCLSKKIKSFACYGTCPSYMQVGVIILYEIIPTIKK